MNGNWKKNKKSNSNCPPCWCCEISSLICFQCISHMGYEETYLDIQFPWLQQKLPYVFSLGQDRNAWVFAFHLMEAKQCIKQCIKHIMKWELYMEFWRQNRDSTRQYWNYKGRGQFFGHLLRWSMLKSKRWYQRYLTINITRLRVCVKLRKYLDLLKSHFVSIFNATFCSSLKSIRLTH